MAKKRKNKTMAGYGKKGQQGLRKKLGEAGFKKHMAKIARDRWKNRKDAEPEPAR